MRDLLLLLLGPSLLADHAKATRVFMHWPTWTPWYCEGGRVSITEMLVYFTQHRSSVIWTLVLADLELSLIHFGWRSRRHDFVNGFEYQSFILPIDWFVLNGCKGVVISVFRVDFRLVQFILLRLCFLHYVIICSSIPRGFERFLGIRPCGRYLDEEGGFWRN